MAMDSGDSKRGFRWHTRWNRAAARGVTAGVMAAEEFEGYVG